MGSPHSTPLQRDKKPTMFGEKALFAMHSHSRSNVEGHSIFSRELYQFERFPLSPLSCQDVNPICDCVDTRSIDCPSN